MTFAHRAPVAVRFAALAAGVLDLFLGIALLVLGLQQSEFLALRIVGLILVATSWLVPWILLVVRYEFEGGELRVTRAFLTRRIPLAAIEAVRPADAVAEGAGLIVEHQARGRRGFEAVQPADDAEFLRHLLMLAPHLEPAGESAARRRAPIP